MFQIKNVTGIQGPSYDILVLLELNWTILQDVQMEGQRHRPMCGTPKNTTHLPGTRIAY